MTQSARTKRWQRVIDCIAGAIGAGLGALMLCRFIAHPVHHWILSIAWACLLIGSGAAIIVGAALRTIQPGRQQSVGFQFELGGWGAAAFLVFWFAVIHYQHDHDLALLLALMWIVVMLLGSWLRLVAAMDEATGGRLHAWFRRLIGRQR